ncbi:MAG: Gfo/Idh/MocA family oxidoreductase [Actinomycetota bacterium]
MTIGVAVVGYGYWGVNMTRNVGTARTTELVGVVDPDPDRRALAAQNNAGITTWETLDDALRDARVEAVVIATPASTHMDLAVQCLEAGRDILVEKPLAETSADAEKIAQLAADRERVLMVGHTFLYSPSVHRLKSLIDEGDLGAVQYLYSQRLSLGRIRRDCNALWNFAPHDVSIMLHLLQEPVVEVTAKGFAFIDPEVDDVCFASLTFASGVGANLHVSWIDPRKTRLMTVVGDEKMAIYNDVSVDQPLWLVDSGVAKDRDLGSFESLGDFQWRTRSGDIVIPRIEMSEPLRNEIEAFGEACLDRSTPTTDGEHGLEVVRILEAIDRSAQASGRPVEVGA